MILLSVVKAEHLRQSLRVATSTPESLIPLTEPLIGPADSLSMSTESQASAEPSVSPVSSFDNLSPPDDVGEVYDMVSKLTMRGKNLQL